MLPMFKGLPHHHFRCILADAPWNFKVRSEKGTGRSASNHYEVQDINWIKALPVRDYADLDCWLFLWSTTAMMPEALDVMRAWGFRYAGSGFCWVKLNKVGDGYFTGMGFTTRKNVELCLLGRRGNPPRRSKRVRELIVARRREHSRKPDEAHERIEAFSWGPRLELFGRQKRYGWTVRGDETTRFSSVDSVA